MPGSPSFPRAWRARRSPAAGAAVMATATLSVGLDLVGRDVLSRIALAVAAVAWLALAGDCVVRLLRNPGRWERGTAVPAALTGVAATTVLGTRIAALEWTSAAEALLALSTVLWAGLLPSVFRHLPRGMPGSVFLGSVATQGLAVLGATLAASETAGWLARAALVLFWIGIVLYGIALTRFDLRQVAEGAGDQWVATGALAISAFAGARLLDASGPRLYLWNDDDRGVLRTVTVALLVLGLCWYSVLLAAEVARPRLNHDARRWATVHPMGMTAVAALSGAGAVGLPSLEPLGRALLWVAVVACLAVATEAGRSAVAAVRSTARR
ncbi:tellurite resistance/C4-dicarboxylate transporter family protein [Streptomyces sp. MUM 136J]|uniref:tellurite resistance/C4-dicarboxylate transporter family protein n=1 Tax=Streptomyces sp. MUM 136J TaxID=2791992 RepID=UPI001F046FA8|nr:tellurite resistance/C4-dicarboxylate transporter family protein [Streptomyces sp. MUM 136J]MCH0570733.1 tellurite resistance/C4-dicarboxylate transporter family protein [Streptomyces sp. MUM 136J]